MNEELLYALFGGLIIYAAIRFIVRIPGRSLNKKFVSLGDFTNLSKDDFLKKAGTPTAIHNFDDGSQLCQWYATGYKMAIVFDNTGKFVKIHSEIQGS